ncbi:hypothetical protein CN568_23065 [Bacillus pseudomycoides]|uniref:Uncharacterized protein n=1 Tax=Bacillus pseudomycoides TaxID=64104 RepID=A0ABD6T6M6_9BACI|nr:hypothetical protein [Bacillus pseudomycoides]MCR8860873.1 hypothetical protein [Bacillus pseudomycoides]MED1477917.1 hypothetical protein [Bacillus pseudomycoides]MED1624328.1 hypothetical protein [Bacillus pseudomycoides]PEF25263.1 hypothetical protein CON69_07590 [Bacillus pseudomycoides]PEJ16825.1 hypothetical protein CN887_30050 [Bacillus pseudomycoides]
MEKMKVEFEVKGFGEEKVLNVDDAFKSIEIARVNGLSKDTTLGELESILKAMFDEVEKNYENPPQFTGRITIRAKKENAEIKYYG